MTRKFDTKYLKGFIVSKKLSQKSFSSTCGIAKSQLNNYIMGTYQPKPEVLERIVKAFPDFDLERAYTEDTKDTLDSAANPNLNSVDLLELFRFTTENLVKLKDEVVSAKDQVIEVLQSGIGRAQTEADAWRDMCKGKGDGVPKEIRQILKDLHSKDALVLKKVEDVEKTLSKLVNQE